MVLFCVSDLPTCYGHVRDMFYGSAVLPYDLISYLATRSRELRRRETGLCGTSPTSYDLWPLLTAQELERQLHNK